MWRYIAVPWIFFILLVNTVCLAQNDLRFKQIANGFSHSHVKTICQDHMGYMWFGTSDGLNKYDGYSVQAFKSNSDDSLSIIGSNIHHLFVDSRNNLWISTNQGSSRYNHKTGQFINQEELRGLNITIYEDRSNNIWAYGWNVLFLFNEKTQTFEPHDQFEPSIRYFYQDKKGIYWAASVDDVYTYDIQQKKLTSFTPIKAKSIIQIYEDSRNKIWFASMEEGLIKYDRQDQTTVRFVHDHLNPNSLVKNAVQCIYEDHAGRLWIGTMNGGISILNVETGIFSNYYNNIDDPFSLSFNSVYSFFEDNNQKMWIGTFNGGVDYVDEKKFDLYKSQGCNSNSLSENRMLFFLEDQNKKVWIGTDGGGVNLFDRQKNHFTHYRHDPNDPRSISSDVVISIVEDSKGNIWLGHWEAGISFFDKKNKRFINYRPSKEYAVPQWIDDCILFMYEDKRSNLWVATLRELTLFDKQKKQFISYHIEGGNMLNYVGSIIEDKDGDLWIGSWEGLYLLDRETGEIDILRHDKDDKNSLSSSQVYMLYEDSKERIWVGTAGGLNLFHKQTKTFQSYTEKDGLPSNAIYSIAEDEDGNLWLGTGNGLSKFDPTDESFRNFDVNDGLQGNEFKNHASLKLSTGELIFGGSNGFNLFDPTRIKMNQFVPPIVITDFKIFNHTVPIGEPGSPLKKHISQTKLLELKSHHSVLSFEFAALNYQLSVKNKYAYIMEGFDKEWIYSGDKRSATYTNLNPGTYVFRVKASNNDGLWNEEGTHLKIVIKPAFYQTGWFRIIIVIVLTVIVWFIISSVITKQQQSKLEAQVKERTHELSIQKDNLQKANFEIKEQGEKLEVLYKEMKDSIKAAKAIQQSVLPSGTLIYNFFPDSFILEKPKDEVSGDFYWINQVEDKIVIAVVDCTGHGVSGAFMSIISNHLLNKSIYGGNCVMASGILDRLNCNLVQELRQIDNSHDITNGMDIALCILDTQTMKLNYAGANSPLYIVRNQILHKYKANPFPIGLNIKKTIDQFDEIEIDINKGDMIYMFSDGYADQLGGPGGTDKFMYQKFRNLLVSISDKDVALQRNQLERALKNWQQNQEQLDDILIVGFRI